MDRHTSLDGQAGQVGVGGTYSWKALLEVLKGDGTDWAAQISLNRVIMSAYCIWEQRMLRMRLGYVP